MPVTTNPPEAAPRTAVSAVGRTIVRNVHAPYAARRFARTALLAWGLPGLLDTAELIVSEFAVNAYEHGDGPFIDVRLECRDGAVTIKVWDANGAKLPETASAGPLDESGRGLMIAEALARQCGAYRVSTGGKVVFAVIPGAE